MTKYQMTNHAHLTTLTSFPAVLINWGVWRCWGRRLGLQVKSLDQIPFKVIDFATAHIAVLGTVRDWSVILIDDSQYTQAHQNTQCSLGPRVHLHPVYHEDRDA